MKLEQRKSREKLDLYNMYTIYVFLPFITWWMRLRKEFIPFMAEMINFLKSMYFVHSLSERMDRYNKLLCSVRNMHAAIHSFCRVFASFSKRMNSTRENDDRVKETAKFNPIQTLCLTFKRNYVTIFHGIR